MSAPGPTTMKTFQKRLYTVLPRSIPPSSPSSRVRSSSAPSRTLYSAPTTPLAYFDSPPPPQPSKPHILSTSRLPVKAEGEGSTHQSHGQPPFSLALTSPQANSSSPPHTPPSHQSSSFFPYSPFATIPFYNICFSDAHTDSHPREKKQKVRYHLDVGAYGIPKKVKGQVSGRGVGIASSNNWLKTDVQQPKEDLTLAVQVGEDAYFIQDNAMGVADGVGGWSRAKIPDAAAAKYSSTDPSPSALFARRLMHHCSAEVRQAESSSSRRRDVSPSPSTSPRRHPGSTALTSPRLWNAEIDDLHEELEDSLEDLEDGLDVLMILERAYESTLKAHVVPECSKAVPTPILTSIPEDVPLTTSIEFPQSILHAPEPPPPKMIPLMTGSSTALVAVLQHSSSTPPTATSPPRPFIFHSPPDITSREQTHDAVLKIAHLGDCMGMLVRDEKIAWRSEEMWWAFNAPVQLGPTSSAQPRDAQILSLPVQADDILILASDGLSDNLWDYEVLDEVVRFKRSFLTSDREGGEGLLGRRTLAGMLSEALCSRARRVSERSGCGLEDGVFDMEGEVPFACRAREVGKPFRGGKIDDISVVVAVISPATGGHSAS